MFQKLGNSFACPTNHIDCSENASLNTIKTIEVNVKSLTGKYHTLEIVETITCRQLRNMIATEVAGRPDAISGCFRLIISGLGKHLEDCESPICTRGIKNHTTIYCVLDLAAD